MKYTQKEVDLLLKDERTSDAIYDGIYQTIDNTLLYYEDYEEALKNYTNIVDVLHGKYTMDNLIDDIFNDMMNDLEQMNYIIDDYLDDDLVNEVLEL